MKFFGKSSFFLAFPNFFWQLLSQRATIVSCHIMFRLYRKWWRAAKTIKTSEKYQNIQLRISQKIIAVSKISSLKTKKKEFFFSIVFFRLCDNFDFNLIQHLTSDTISEGYNLIQHLTSMSVL